MDYISEAERMKLYYKGLSLAGDIDQIAVAHPDMVSDIDDSDSIPELHEVSEWYLHVLLPLYHKLAYVCNNRFIHEYISYYAPEPQRVWTAEEIYAALYALDSYAVPELIRTIGCTSSILTQLQQAYDAQDKAAFINIIDTSDCDLLLTSCVCEDIWPQIVYLSNPSDEDIANSLDVVASMFCDDEHPISRSSKELSEAVEPLFEDGDEEEYVQKYKRYNQDLFDYMCEFYRDNLKRFKPKERKQIEPLILKGGGCIEKEFHLPEDYFSFRNEFSDSSEFFGLHPDVIKAGAKQFEVFVNSLSQLGYIDTSPAVKRLFAYRFSGRMRPAKVEPIEWHGKNGNSYELIYLVRNMTEHKKGKYDKMRSFFTGPKWLAKYQDSNNSGGANRGFKELLHEFYPTLTDQL